MSKYYNPKLGRLWRRAKRSDHSRGAASEVRHIDPATYQIPAEISAAPAAKPKHKALRILDAADRLLLKDIRKHHGKRHRDRARLKIIHGRCSSGRQR